MKIKRRLKNDKKKERKAKKVTYSKINYFTQIFRVLIQCLYNDKPGFLMHTLYINLKKK